jgi:hypothetical protein
MIFMYGSTILCRDHVRRHVHVHVHARLVLYTILRDGRYHDGAAIAPASRHVCRNRVRSNNILLPKLRRARGERMGFRYLSAR